MEQERCCVNLSVRPSRLLMDEKFSVFLVENTVPGAQLTLHAICYGEKGQKWEAYGHYNSDATGRVNVCEDPSLGGTYSGVEPMGLMWSLRAVYPKAWVRFDVQTPVEVIISVYPGHRTEGFKEEEQLASVLVERWHMVPGARRIPITQQDVTATLFLPPGPGPFPGILDLMGADKQLLEYRAALLASHGFAVMALNYTTPAIALRTGTLVDNAYFETAYRVLQQHPQVMGSRIAMVGLCTGAVMTLIMAVYSEVIKLRCAVLVNGIHLKHGNGTVKDFLDYYLQDNPKIRYNEENELISRDAVLPIPTDPALKVDLGRLQCPLLVIVGEDDQCFPAYEAAMDMKEMMEEAGNSHLLTVLSYPKTGHVMSPPYHPHERVSSFAAVTDNVKVVTLWGGETASHCLAEEDSWRKILHFLRKNLSCQSHL